MTMPSTPPAAEPSPLLVVTKERLEELKSFDGFLAQWDNECDRRAPEEALAALARLLCGCDDDTTGNTPTTDDGNDASCVAVAPLKSEKPVAEPPKREVKRSSSSRPSSVVVSSSSYSTKQEDVCRVSWQGIRTAWFHETFVQLPEVQAMLAFGCRMWFVREYGIKEMLRRRGITTGPWIDHLSLFTTATTAKADDDKDSGTEAKEEERDNEAVKSVSPVDDATMFISFTGAYTLEHFIQILQEAEHAQEQYIWIDSFCVDQFAWGGANATNKEDAAALKRFKRGFMNELSSKIGSIPSTALLLDHWDDVMATLGQIWVLWEVYCSIKSNAKLFVTFRDNEKYLFAQKELAGGTMTLLGALASIDARKARSHRPEDKELILSIMEKEKNGVANVNRSVTDCMRDWMVKVALKEMTAFAVKRSRDDLCDLMNNVGLLFRTVGALGAWENVARQVLENRLGRYQVFGQPTQVATCNLALALTDNGKYAEAEKLLEVALARPEMQVIDSDAETDRSTVVSIMTLYAQLLLQKGKFEEAGLLLQNAHAICLKSFDRGSTETTMCEISMAQLDQTHFRLKESETRLEETLETLRNIHGYRHPEIANILNFLAIVNDETGDFEKAESRFRESLVLSQEVLGRYSNLTLRRENDLGNFLRRRGNLKEANDILHKVMEECTARYGKLDAGTVASMASYADCLFDMGRLEDSESLLFDALRSSQEAGRESTLDSLKIAGNLGIVLQRQGKLDDAMAMHVKALEGHRIALGDQHPTTFEYRNNIASCQVKLGEIDKAKGTFIDVLSGYKMYLGEEHPKTLSVQSHYANCLGLCGQVQEAVALMSKNQAVFRKVLGSRHPDTLSSLHNLAQLNVFAGDKALAEKLFVEVLEQQKAVLGDKHPDTLTTLNSFASLVKTQKNRLDEAEFLYLSALKGRREVHGENNLLTLQTLHNLAWVYEARGKVLPALQQFNAALEGLRNLVGRTHRETLTVAFNLAQSYQKIGDLAKAVALYREVVQGFKERFGPTHQQTRLAAFHLVNLLCQMGNAAEAERLIDETRREQSMVLGETNPVTLTWTRNLAEFLYKNGRFEEARGYAKAAFDGFHGALGGEDLNSLMSTKLLALIIAAQDQAEDAANFFTKAHHKHREVLGPTHPLTLELGVAFARWLANVERFDDAEEVYSRQLDACRERLSDDHSATVETLFHLSTFWLGRSRLEEAETGFREVWQTARRTFGEGDRRSIQAINALAETLRKDNREDEANELLLQVRSLTSGLFRF